MIARALWLLFTVGAYLVTRRAQALAKGSPLVNPVIFSAALVLAAIAITGRDPAEYRASGAILLWMLGPATVALAVPLQRSLRAIASAFWPSISAIAVGSIATVLSALAIGRLLGAEPDTLRALAAKSVTTPIAMAITAELGGPPALAAVFVILTGGLGAMLGGSVFRLVKVDDPRARGIATGVVAHGMGTAHAFQVDVAQGTFSGIAMTLNGIATAFVLPVLWLLFAR